MKDLQINEQIRDKEVRLISSTGEQLGVVSGREAYNMAREKNLDLVKIAPKGKPPVCKIMDYGKYKYEQAKIEKESRKKQKVITVKEIRLRPRIEEHDMLTKSKQARKFLEKGDKVKVTVRFRGRELGHKELGFDVINNFLGRIEDISVPEKKPKFEGNSLVVILSPKKD
ncbi:MAG: translation initiation factor IF-3 [Peptostreptococcaceae bacterium]|nr:translation initiation factor IF-3 [Peptostreptococcaceae bacterium]